MTTSFNNTLAVIMELNIKYNTLSEQLDMIRNNREYNDICTEMAAISERISHLTEELHKIAKIHAESDYEYVEYDADKRRNRSKNFVDEYFKVCKDSKVA